jgi:tRNA-specific 2-thiouridylase
LATVVVGLSGGVDSSVAAHLLIEQGHDVIGVFMKNWHDETVVINNECPWIEDSNDALLVAEKLGIPFQVVDLSAEYKSRIVDYMFAEYEAGRTPNPDVLCNREIKFDAFAEIALNLGAEYVATGHYCQKSTSISENGEEVHHLISGADKGKDQSYFLCQISQEQLSKALFPIGHLQKSEVRKIAAEQDLITAGKKDSQGLCFVGKISLPEFLQQKLAPKEGSVFQVPNQALKNQVDAFKVNSDLELLSAPFNLEHDDNILKGKHIGAHYYTVGQRKGLGIGGTVEPLFVIGTDVEKNIVYVGEGTEHAGLYRPALKLDEVSLVWINASEEIGGQSTLEIDCRIRYRQSLQKAILHAKDGKYYITFTEWQRGITSGQFAAFYLDGELVGSAVIQ